MLDRGEQAQVGLPELHGQKCFLGKAHAVFNGKIIVRVDHRYFRPTEVETLLGDPTKAKEKLGWVPEISLDQMVTEMVQTDLAEAKKSALLKQHGYQVAVSVE